MKKIIILMLAVLSVVWLYTTAENRNGMVLTDTQAAIDYLYANGLTKFNTTQTFMANQSLRRDEAAAFFARFARDVLGMVPDTNKSECNSFSDLSQGHYDLQGEMIAACQLWLMRGSNGKFMPTASLSNAHALTVMVRLLDGDQSEIGAHRASNYLLRAQTLGLTTGLSADNSNKLDTYITRGEVARLIEAWSVQGRIDHGHFEENTDLSDCNVNSAPSINLSSPNSSETWKIGQTYNIERSTCNAPTDSWIKFTYYVPAPSASSYAPTGTTECIGQPIPTSQNSYAWEINESLWGCSDAGWKFELNTSFQTKVKAEIYTGTPACEWFPAPNHPCLTGSRTLHAQDESDYFTITNLP
jgi:hypothetical protein